MPVNAAQQNGPADDFGVAKAAARQASFASIGNLLSKQARIRGDKICLREGPKSWTYRELDQEVSRVSAYLIAKGMQRGDRVAILSRNSAFYLILGLAAARTGSILVTLNWRLSPHELDYAVSLVAPRLLFYAGSYADALTEIKPGPELIEASESVLTEIYAHPPLERPVQVEPEDGCLIIYTSGTTGFPKAALISQRALIARLHIHFIDYGFDHEDVFYAWSPLFHTAAIDLSIATLIMGGSVVVTDGMDFELLVELMEREKLSNLMFFPGMITDMITRLRERKPRVRGIKKFGAFADLVKPEQIAEVTTLLNAPYCNTFGMTEAGTSPASAGFLPIGKEPENRAKRENSLCEVQVVNAEGIEVGPDEAGELVLRGPVLFSGYWGDAAATREAFRGGWYHTGDIFVRHADGSLTYSGRQKYLIKSGGENIYPAEIERALMTHPDVVEAVVVAARDEKWGEVPIAVVSLSRPEGDINALAAHCETRLAKYKRPKGILVVEDAFFPRNNTGKVIRATVETWVAQQRMTKA